MVRRDRRWGGSRRRAEVLSTSFLAVHLGFSQVVRCQFSFTSLSSCSSNLTEERDGGSGGLGQSGRGEGTVGQGCPSFSPRALCLEVLVACPGHDLPCPCLPLWFFVCFLLQNSTHGSACCQGASHCIWQWKKRIIISPAFVCSSPKQGLAHHCTNP